MASKGNFVISRAPDQVACDLGDEAAILHLKDGIYYGLDSIGAYIWNLIESPICFVDLRTRLMQEYDVEADQCERDLLAFLETMKERGLITITDEKN